MMDAGPREDHAAEAAILSLEPQEFPCTSPQRQFWLLDRLNPGDPALNVAVRWRLDGQVSPELLARSFEAVIARHESLRTGFTEVADGVVQRVLPQVAFRLATVDLRAEAEPEAAALREARAEASQPFDLAAPPLLRTRLLRIEDRLYHLLVTIHHVISDGWSVGVLAEDIVAHYNALRGDGAMPDPLPLQYGDYALWQEAWLASQAPRPSEAYWTRQLAAAPWFEVPSDRLRPPVVTSNGHIVSILLPQALTDRLKAVAGQGQATLFMVFHAAMAALLARWTGEAEVVLGTQVANREQAELEPLIGVFINTIVLRVALGDDPSFAALLARCRRTVLDALDHAQLPGERVVELLRPVRDASRRHPLFSVNIVVHRDFIAPGSTADFRLASIPSVSPGAIYDLNFFMVERERVGWRLSCEYNTDLFEQGTVERLLRCLGQVLQAVAEDGSRRVSALPLLDAEERQSLAAALNGTARPFPREVALPELLADAARRHPARLAVRCGARQMTHGELEAHSNAVAHALAALGVRQGQVVGFAAPRSAEALAVLLGIWKAGAVFLPLDPALPATRLSQAAEDAAPALVLVGTAVPAGLEATATLPLAMLLARAAAAPRTGIGPGPRPEEAAYIMFTSGSTGRPKGVMVHHRGLVNELWQFQDTLRLRPDDAMLSLATLSFDIALIELLLPLLAGASVVVAEEEEARDAMRLADFIRRSGVTVAQTTPSRWSLLLDAGLEGARLRMALVGGEALTRTLANALLRHAAELWNLYGPTETTVWASAIRIMPGDGPIRIGGPIGNLRFQVLNQHGALVPMGAPGELWIGGEGVALGYVGRPELTRERFVPLPFAPEDGRYYRTGDLVRRHPDGSFDFLGRCDQQVKLHGVRIELGEVEVALLAEPEVSEAVAMVREDRPGDRRLVAYAVPAAGIALPGDLGAVLKSRIAARLPAAMVPAQVVVLAALPRTPTAKIDRRALPAAVPEAVAPAAAPPGPGPDDELAAIWQEILGVRPAPENNFFDLGGNSLLAARLLLRVRLRFGVSLTLAALFRAPRLRDFALLLRGVGMAAEDREVVRVQPSGTRTPIIAINNTGIFHRLARHLGPDQPFYAVQALDPDMPVENHPAGLEPILDRYLAAIRRTQPQGPYILIGLCTAGQLAWALAERLRAAGEEIRLVVLVDAWAPHHLAGRSRASRLLAEASYRARLLAAELRRLARGQQTLGGFIAGRGVLIRRRHRRDQRMVAAGRLPVLPFETRDALFVGHLSQAVRGYDPPRQPGPVLVFHREDQPRGAFLDPSFGWGRLVEGRIGVHALPGNHLSIFEDPGAAIMARRIAESLG
jgi:amino acid adenylation domain-containing protein